MVDLGPLGQQTAASSALIGVGVLTIASLTFTFTRFLLSTFVLPGQSLTKFGDKTTYAVVTGASDGIGKEYALQLARKGFNLLLVSRTQSKLDALSESITSTHPNTTVQTLSIDFAAPSEQDYTNLTAALADKKVAILVNNVGQSHSIPVTFLETEQAELQNIIRINCEATLRVTQAVLPRMLPQKKGLILTMGSFGGLVPTPLLATYSGSKAFLQAWSHALAGELAPKGITVHFVHSYLVTSAMSKIRRPSLLIPNERTFVRSVLAKIGRRGGSIGFANSGSPYWSHALVAFLVTGVTGVYSTVVRGVNMGTHVDIRRRALRKMEREKGGAAAVEGKKAR